MIKDFEQLKNLSNSDFYSNFAYIMHVALIKDESLYMRLINDMYEICSLERDVIEEIIASVNKDEEIIKAKDIRYFNFGQTMASTLKEAYKDKYKDGEYLSLGCVAEAFISYKKNWLTKEEYYEIRDMFVPFYLPISIEMLNIDETLENFKDVNSVNSNGQYTFTLLKKVGKCVIDETVTIDEVKEALNELNFDEAW